jgi:hypothetical protein
MGSQDPNPNTQHHRDPKYDASPASFFARHFFAPEHGTAHLSQKKQKRAFKPFCDHGISTTAPSFFPF